MHGMIQKSLEICQRHATQIYQAISIITLSIILSYCYQSYQKAQHSSIADSFFELTRKGNQPDHDALNQFAKKHEGTIFSDICRLKLASYYHQHGNHYELVKENLEKIVNTSSRSNLRSLAAYRLANYIKHTEPSKALILSEKIEIKSLRHLRGLLRSELYRKENDLAKALLEINSLLSDIEMDNESDSQLIIELATQEKRQIINEQKKT